MAPSRSSIAWSARLAAFGSLPRFREAFVAEGEKHFGSGWLGLIESQGGVRIESTHDADCPLGHDQTALLGCDL